MVNIKDTLILKCVVHWFHLFIVSVCDSVSRSFTVLLNYCDIYCTLLCNLTHNPATDCKGDLQPSWNAPTQFRAYP